MDKDSKTSMILKVLIRRTEVGAPEEFEVPYNGPILVLDLLHWISENVDSGLTYRYSCRTGRCGTCTVTVNNQPVLACQKQIETHQRTVVIEPLKGLPSIRDLLVDMQPFRARWERVVPFLNSEGGLEGTEPISNQSEERLLIDPSRACIKCGACYSACGMSADGKPFLGPAALNRAMILIADSRDQEAARRLKDLSGPVGVDSCHYQGSCTHACPQGLNPAAAINRLRKWRLKGSP